MANLYEEGEDRMNRGIAGKTELLLQWPLLSEEPTMPWNYQHPTGRVTSLGGHGCNLKREKPSLGHRVRASVE